MGERYFVLVQLANHPEVIGWRVTRSPFGNREDAEGFAESLERAQRWEGGGDVTHSSYLVTRVISASEILRQEGEQALRDASEGTFYTRRTPDGD